MATMNYYNALYSGTASGFVTAATPTLITVSIPGAEADNYHGSFSYNSNGDLVAGVLTSLDSSYLGRVSFTITDFSVPAVPVANAILAGDALGAVAIILAGPDQIFGSSLGDPILGFSGDDTIIALDGNDTVSGDDGNDDVNGNVGQDIVVGGTGNDTVRGGKDNDTITGGDGDDGHVNGNIGDDIVLGGAGRDTVYGGQGADTLYGEAGNDLLSGDLGNDVMYGGAGADRFTIRAGGGADWVADFNAIEGDRIQLAPGTAYSVSSYQGQVVIDLGGGDMLALSGVASSSFSSSWIVFE
jgi:serralysin